MNKDSDSLEDRLKKIEELVELMLERLERVEIMLRELDLGGEITSTAIRLTILLSLPASKALEAARRALSVLNKLQEEDPITRAIIEVLSGCEELSLTEITRRVRSIRGTASRRIIRDRILLLCEKGVVKRVSAGKSKYVLSACVKQENKRSTNHAIQA